MIFDVAKGYNRGNFVNVENCLTYLLNLNGWVWNVTKIRSFHIQLLFRTLLKSEIELLKLNWKNNNKQILFSHATSSAQSFDSYI